MRKATSTRQRFSFASALVASSRPRAWECLSEALEQATPRETRKDPVELPTSSVCSAQRANSFSQQPFDSEESTLTVKLDNLDSISQYLMTCPAAAAGMVHNHADGSNRYSDIDEGIFLLKELLDVPLPKRLENWENWNRAYNTIWRP